MNKEVDSKTRNYYRWYDESDNTRIKIDDDYRINLINRAIRKAGHIDLLSKNIELDRATIYNYLKGMGMSVIGLKKILEYLDINYNRINHKVIETSWNFKPNIKINNKEMAILLAASLADGHLDDGHFMYKNLDLELRDRIKKNLFKVFGDINIREFVAKNGVPYFTTSVGVRKVLENLGSPRGKKSQVNPKVPKIVRNGTKEMKRVFIQQFFDDEGWSEREHFRIAIAQSVDCTDQISQDFLRSMQFKKDYTPLKIPKNLRNNLRIPNLLKDIQELLIKDFNIYFNFQLKGIAKYKKRNDDEYASASWDLQCSKLEEIIKFRNKINFGLTRKKESLNWMLTRNRIIPKNILNEILEISIKETKNKGFFKTKDIAKAINLPSNMIRKRLNTLVKKGVLKNKNGDYTINFKV